VLIAVLAVAGCGSDDDKGGSTAAKAPAGGVTRASYIKAADAVCQAGSNRMKAVITKLPNNPSKAQIREFTVKTAIPELNREVRELRALPRPVADKARLDEIYDSLQTAVGQLKTNPDLVSASGPQSPFTKPNQLAHKYGLKICGAS